MGIQDRSYYRDGESDWNPAPKNMRSVVITVIIINVGIFLLDAFTKETAGPGSLRWLAFTLAEPDLYLHPQYFWTLLTSGFAHSSMGTGNPFHVVFNMLTLFFLGRAVEEHYGRHEFLKFYLIAIVVAGLGWQLSVQLQSYDPQSPPLALGASGGVAAVVMLFVFNFPRSTLLLFGVIPIRAWILGVVMVGMDILNGFNPDSHIAVEAHLTGAAFAAAYYYLKWNFGWLKIEKLGAVFSGKPRLKVHNPQVKSNQRRSQLREQADRILQKLHTEGEESLSKAERRILEKYSRMVRDQRDD